MQAFAERMIAALSEAQVEFVVVGGLSAVLHGVPIVTQDLDICYRRTPESISMLAAALAPFHPRMRGLPPDVPNFFDERSLQLGMNFTLEIEDESLDVLGQMSAIGGYDQIIDRTEEMDVAGHRVRVLSLADLVTTKRAAGRAKDIATLPLIEATLKMRRDAAEG